MCLGCALNPTGQVSIEFHGGWRIETDRTIACGDQSGPDDIERALAGLIGRAAVELTTVGQLPEISLILSDGGRLVSFTAVAGDPDWAVVDRRVDPAQWFHVQDGAVFPSDGGPPAHIT